MHIHNKLNIGEFQEVGYNQYFTYRKTDAEYAVKHGLTHEIDVLDGIRYATVKKTVVYVATDEDEDGKPVIEKWNIKNHLVYNQ
jgi:uncharacterized protein YggL (DUF469 family)